MDLWKKVFDPGGNMVESVGSEAFVDNSFGIEKEDASELLVSSDEEAIEGYSEREIMFILCKKIIVKVLMIKFGKCVSIYDRKMNSVTFNSCEQPLNWLLISFLEYSRKFLKSNLLRIIDQGREFVGSEAITSLEDG
jgi:hypothetical protein